ncbi:MAG: GntR family transcriptional regulator [Planctomycetes bacterium]|nr:GntR family transcriptional regulator [Planctomycetota bacterium]
MSDKAPKVYMSKAVRLSEQLREEIAEGMYSLGSLMPTEMELVKTYQVSRVTIRRSLSILIEEGVLLKLPHRGVMVQGVKADGSGPLISHLSNKDFTLAAMLASQPDEGLSRMQQGIEDFAKEYGMAFRLLSNDMIADNDDPFSVLEHVEELGIDGVIVLPYPGEPRTEILQSLHDRGFPIVCIERRHRDMKLPSVEPDNKTGMYRATKHLISKYRRPVHYLGLTSAHKTDTDRYDGYVRAMKDSHFEDDIESHTCLHAMNTNDPAFWEIDQAWKWGYEIAHDIFKDSQAPYSMACLNDYIAWGVYRAAEEIDLEIGKDIHIVGFDDLEIASMLVPPLTTVRQALEEKGYQAAHILRQCMLGDLRVPIQITLPVELIERASA